MMTSSSLVSSGIMAVMLVMQPMLALQAHAGISASISVVNGQPGVAVAYHPDYGFGHYPTATYVHAAPTRVVETTYGYDGGYGAPVYPTQQTVTTTTYTQYPTVIYRSATVVPPPVVVRQPVIVVAPPRCYSASNWRCVDQGGYYPRASYRDYRRAPRKVAYIPVNVPHSR